MTGVVVTFRGVMSKPAWFETSEQAAVFAAWVRRVFAYDSVSVIGGDR